jgi:hypothetical protein
MAASTRQVISVLVGPTCPNCETDDLRCGALHQSRCSDCATDYRSYAVPDAEPTCPGCGVPHDEQQTGHVFCEDCGPSDCRWCGATVYRWQLSENLACFVCERGEVA